VSVTEDDGEGEAVGSAVALVEYFTGRTDQPVDGLPDDLAAHLDRARQIL
jgi:hypothetical protein